MMEPGIFMENYREAFGDTAELPVAFWYSDQAVNPTAKINGCFFKGMKDVRAGIPISLNAGVIGCMGGKFYTGFTGMPAMVPNFVSQKERYKQTPEMVLDFIHDLDVPETSLGYLNFARLDQIDSFDRIEGLLFLVNPDILSGLAAWAFFDRNEDDTVTSLFGSGCSSVVTQAVQENRRNGKRTFIGFFDPSVRIHFEPDILSFMIPHVPVQGNVSYHEGQLPF